MTDARTTRRWGVVLGLVLLVPELVLTVWVVHQPIVVGLAGFAMTLGFLRLALVGYAVLRERLQIGRGALLFIGLIATIVGALLYAQTVQAVASIGDAGFRGAIAPPAAIGLNLVVVLVLGLWITGVVVGIAAIAGAVRASRRP